MTTKNDMPFRIFQGIFAIVLKAGRREERPVPRVNMPSQAGITSIEATKNDVFPEGFEWGVSSSACQIEGAWNEDGKGESIWDVASHDGRYNDGDTPDIACNSYHNYKRDVEMLKSLGVSSYRFSLAWTRLIPDPRDGVVNEKAVDYYDRLINELIKANIKPVVTLFHFDHSKIIADTGGWANERIVDHFGDLADLAFKRFGDRVKCWITINEPFVFSMAGYGLGMFPVTNPEPVSMPYVVGHNMLKAHARAWHIYDNTYRINQNGQVSIALDCTAMIPKDPSNADDREAAERSQQFQVGWFAHPIFGAGDYPDVMKSYIREASQEHGTSSRLPEFTPKEIEYIKGTGDFFCLNHYVSRLVEPFKDKESVCRNKMSGGQSSGWVGDQKTHTSVCPDWPRTALGMTQVYPPGLRYCLNWIKKEYNNIRVLVAENGFPTLTDDVNDTERVDYLREYLTELLKAVREDGCNVGGYFVWSLMDNFEWAFGYSIRFGLYSVDFADATRPTKPRLSKEFYEGVIKHNGPSWLI